MDKIKVITSKPLNNTDKLLIGTHLLIILIFWVSYEQRLIPTETMKDLVSGYFFMLPLLLIGMFFRNLRNFNFFIAWIAIAIIQLMIYPELHDLRGFQNYRGSALTPLRSLLPALLIFQLLRIIFIKTHNMDMIISLRQYRMSRWEEEENRNMTWLEVAFSITIAITVVLSNVLPNLKN